MLHPPVHVEDGWEVLWVLVKEILRDLAWNKLLTQLQHLGVIISVKPEPESQSLCPNKVPTNPP